MSGRANKAKTPLKITCSSEVFLCAHGVVGVTVITGGMMPGIGGILGILGMVTVGGSDPGGNVIVMPPMPGVDC